MSPEGLKLYCKIVTIEALAPDLSTRNRALKADVHWPFAAIIYHQSMQFLEPIRRLKHPEWPATKLRAGH